MGDPQNRPSPGAALPMQFGGIYPPQTGPRWRMTHLFKVNQAVDLIRTQYREGSSGRAPCKVVRLLPADQAGVFSYRITLPTGAEMAVSEAEIVAHKLRD